MIPAPDTQPEWEPRFLAKAQRNIKIYQNCPVRMDGAQKFIACIEQNRHLLKNRPQCFQHGDYHIGNMMIENGKLVVIDFDRYDFGDPWEEFNRIVWCAQRRPYLRPAWLTGILTARFRRSSGNCSLCISAAICFLPCLGRFLLASMRLPQC